MGWSLSGYVLGSPEKLLRSLFHTVTARLSLVVITIDGENPYEIFESLNSTGLPLEESDLIRNYLFMEVPLSEQEEFNVSHWQPFEKMFDANKEFPTLSQTAFYRTYLMRTGTYSKDKSTFQDFKSQNRDRKLIPVDQVNELQRFAEFELWLRRPTTCPNRALQKALSQIAALDITTAHSLLVHLLDRYKEGALTEQDLLGCIDDIASFVLRRSICSESTRQYGRWFPEAVKAIQSNVRGDLRDYWMRRGWPDDETFVKRLGDFAIYRRETAKCRLILETLEESYGHREKVQLSNLEIEHVMPQTIGGGKNGQEWKQMLGPDWGPVHERWLHTIGNLTLSGYNRPLGNKPFKEKRSELAKSNLTLNRYFSDLRTWDEQEIQKRATLIGKEVAQLWERPSQGPAYVPSGETELVDLDAKERRDQRQEYWAELIEILAARKNLPALPEPPHHGYVMFRLGWQGVRLFAYRDNWKNVIGVYLRFNKPNAKGILKTLEEKRDEINTRFANELRWNDNRKWK